MKTRNMTNSKGNSIPNQFVINSCDNQGNPVTTFQSYRSTVIQQTLRLDGNWHTELDEYYWDYSVTTRRYRNLFLGEKKAETQNKIDSGEYTLTNLN